MIRSVKETRGLAVLATDGPIGDVHDIFFDDRDWTVRYYVIDTGKWLPGRQVLLPPDVVRESKPGTPGVPVRLTREQIRNSPDVDTARPISRQVEAELYDYYGWAPYWIGMAPGMPMPVDGFTTAASAATDTPERRAEAERPDDDPHLRSARAVTGYYVLAEDGEIGHIEDFLVDDQTERIRYVVVDTRNWLPGKNVLIAPDWITDIRWNESRVMVRVTREAVRNSPEYQPATPVDPDYESRLHTHYGYPASRL